MTSLLVIHFVSFLPLYGFSVPTFTQMCDNRYGHGEKQSNFAIVALNQISFDM